MVVEGKGGKEAEVSDASRTSHPTLELAHVGLSLRPSQRLRVWLWYTRVRSGVSAFPNSHSTYNGLRRQFSPSSGPITMLLLLVVGLRGFWGRYGGGVNVVMV